METQHPRQIIRQRVVDMIRNSSTDAGSRVFDSRDFTLNTGSTPAIIIYTQSEQLEDMEQQDHGLRRRVMTLTAECYHTGDDGAAAVDRMAWQVENILHADPTLGSLVERCKLLSSAAAFADNGELALHAATLTFEITYCTHLYAEGGEPPRTVLIGFDPETGPGHTCDYTEITGALDA